MPWQSGGRVAVPGLPSHPCFPRNQQRGRWESLSTVLSSADRDLKGQQLVMTVRWRWELGEREGQRQWQKWTAMTERKGPWGESSVDLLHKEGSEGESVCFSIWKDFFILCFTFCVWLPCNYYLSARIERGIWVQRKHLIPKTKFR